jgi:hypothetical protein
VRGTSSVSVTPSSRAAAWKGWPAKPACGGTPTTCSATWMSASAQAASSSRAACSASRMPGALARPPSAAAKFSAAERNSISSGSATTPARLTSWSAARQRPAVPR